MSRLTSTRRSALAWLGAGIAVPALAACGSPAAAKSFPLSLSEDAWRKKLTKAQFSVLREEATERPYSSPLNDEHRKGTFLCAGCDHPLFSSATKFDSGTGWPSFYQPLKGAVGTSTDYKLAYPRKEVHCANCGGHLGHVFNDGPKPTGLRYCMNGVAMKFRPA
ncbi:peptide-methionine (R)-S-oxide reductase [Altererythrobacter sp. B11]|uniref:peptide-methionine (R)-S-oxide reductase MsrB n=1 Tax=Altererythrobacter sp. B11 TaxID=2060312 RepID=UPI000DC6DE7A|nr:peptide-methionine (R)-S-oxide reductase MsrB [Altererythrobacter sp. B11]BBC71239.1 peptide-methionine (R)-S-oxide reductase [Altererythrobacter sp. B11]